MSGVDQQQHAPPACAAAGHTLMHAWWHRYVASRNLQKFDAKITTDEDGVERERLEAAVAAEAAVNNTEITLQTGCEAVFGGTYQLLNRSSNKYMQAKKTIAEEDPTALRCSMVDATVRSKMPWFSIRPGFRTRSEGERIRMGDTVVLQSMKMPGMYLHTNIDEDGRDVAEVNIFDKATVRRATPSILQPDTVEDFKNSKSTIPPLGILVYTYNVSIWGSS